MVILFIFIIKGCSFGGCNMSNHILYFDMEGVLCNWVEHLDSWVQSANARVQRVEGLINSICKNMVAVNCLWCIVSTNLKFPSACSLDVS